MLKKKIVKRKVDKTTNKDSKSGDEEGRKKKIKIDVKADDQQQQQQQQHHQQQQQQHDQHHHQQHQQQQHHRPDAECLGLTKGHVKRVADSIETEKNKQQQQQQQQQQHIINQDDEDDDERKDTRRKNINIKALLNTVYQHLKGPLKPNQIDDHKDIIISREKWFDRSGDVIVEVDVFSTC